GRARAQPVPPAAALRTGPAGQRLLDRDARARDEVSVSVLAPGCRDPADHLMTGDERRGNLPFGIPAPVTAADPAGLHLEPGARGGPGPGRHGPHLDRPRRRQHGGHVAGRERAHGPVRPGGSRYAPDRRQAICSSSLARQKVRRSSGSSDTLAPLSRSCTSSLIPRPHRVTCTRTAANSLAITALSSGGAGAGAVILS